MKESEREILVLEIYWESDMRNSSNPFPENWSWILYELNHLKTYNWLLFKEILKFKFIIYYKHLLSFKLLLSSNLSLFPLMAIINFPSHSQGLAFQGYCFKHSNKFLKAFQNYQIYSNSRSIKISSRQRLKGYLDVFWKLKFISRRNVFQNRQNEAV